MTRMTWVGIVLVVGSSCGGPLPGPEPSVDGGAGEGDGVSRSGAGAGVGGPWAVNAEAGWRVESVPGTQCALGAPAGLGYNPGASDELLIFVQGGGACWNNGTCAPSLHQWGPVCNYGTNAPCLADLPGGKRPLAVYVDHPNPFPADGGAAWSHEIGTVRSSVFFARRSENPMANATFSFVPYCTGDLHAGASTRTWLVKPGVFDAPRPRTHAFAGAANMDAYLTWLRVRHPSVRVIWLIGVSGGGYGAQLNLHRVRQRFPEAQVHLLADSAPMLPSPFFPAWQAAWNLQVPQVCVGCDGGMPAILEQQLTDAPTSRVGLLSFSEDEVITRFFFSGPDTASWLAPPFGVYTQALVGLEARYEPRANARYFRLAGRDHVMVQRAGLVLGDGGVSASVLSPNREASLKAWLDAWATGQGPWVNHR